MRSSSVRRPALRVEQAAQRARSRTAADRVRRCRSPAWLLDGGTRRRLRASATSACDRRTVGHERAGAAPADEPAFLLQRAVGARDGVGRECRGPRRTRGPAAADRPAATCRARSGVRMRVAQLFVGRAVAVADPHPQARCCCSEQASRRVSHAPALWFADADPDRARRADARRRRARFEARTRRRRVLACADRDRRSLRAVSMRALGRAPAVRQGAAVRLLRGGATGRTRARPVPLGRARSGRSAGDRVEARRADPGGRRRGDHLRRGAARRSRPVVAVPMRRLTVSADAAIPRTRSIGFRG